MSWVDCVFLPCLITSPLSSDKGVQFAVYELLKKRYHYTRAKREKNEIQSPVFERLEKSCGYLAMGGVAKVVASTTTYPLQVVKARMQQRSEFVEVTTEGNVRVVKREYVGIIETSKRIWAKEVSFELHFLINY